MGTFSHLNLFFQMTPSNKVDVKLTRGAGEMCQCLRILATLAEDLGLISNCSHGYKHL